MEELYKRLKEIQIRLNEMNKVAKDDENRALTDEEQTEWDGLMTEADEVRGKIEVEKKKLSRSTGIENIETFMSAAQNAPHLDGGNSRSDSEFRNLGEFVHAVRFTPNDSRLLEVREQSFGTGSEGGFMVPEQFSQELLSVSPQDAIFRPRATVIPAGTPPDAAISMPTLDQSGTKGVYAGVTVNWIAEGAEKPETEAFLKEIKIEPQEIAGYIIASDKLLRNAPAASVLIQTLLRRAIIASEEDSFLSGSGVGKPLGILNAPATLAINRAVASQIAYADIAGMYSVVKFGGSLVWVGSQTILPQLLTMADASGKLIWHPSAREGIPGTLMGFPLLFNDQSPVLGAKGDLILVDLSYYMIKDGSGIAISASEHVYFKSNKTVIKAFWNVDGQPWLSTPIMLPDGVTQVSPLVILDVP